MLKRSLSILGFAVIAVGALLHGLSGPNIVRAADFSEFSDDGLGIAIEGTVNINLQPSLGYESIAQHRVVISSGYYVGYSLYASVDDNNLKGQKGGVIKSLPNSGKLSTLTNNSWAIDTDDGFYPLWQGFANGERKLVDRNTSQYPSFGYHVVKYGVKVNGITAADSYATHVTYTVLPEVPATPAVLGISKDRYAMGSSDHSIEIRGVNLGDLEAIGMDFNQNMKIDENEQCANLRMIDNKKASCDLPSYLPDANVRRGQKVSIIMKSENITHDTGQSITYYYQPIISAVKSVALSIAPNARINAIASNKSSALAVNDKGLVSWWGGTAYKSGQINFAKLLSPSTLLGEFAVRRSNNVAMGRDSYYYSTVDGYLYQWGDTSRGQMSTPYKTSRIDQPEKSIYFGGNNGRMAKQIAAGDDFAIVLDDNDIYAWGDNRFGQLGRNSTSGGDSSVPIAIKDIIKSEYALIGDEKFIAIAAGGRHALAATSHGRVLTWGYPGDGGGDGRLGFSTNSIAWRPHDITYKSSDYLYNYYRSYSGNGERFYKVAAGNDFSVTLSTNGNVYTFGNNSYGQLGNGGAGGAQAHNITSQFNLQSGELIEKIFAFNHSAGAITNQGHVYVWGQHMNGMSYRPVKLPVQGAEDMSLGSKMTIILQSGDAVVSDSSNESPNWQGQFINLTRKINQPRYAITIEGDYLDMIQKGFVDYNQNGIGDEGEMLEDYYCIEGTKCVAWLPTDSAAAPGNYWLYLQTEYGGSAKFLIEIREIDGAVSRSRRSAREDVVLNDKKIESLGAESAKSEETLVTTNSDLKKESTEIISGAKDCDSDHNDEVCGNDKDVPVVLTNDTKDGGDKDQDNNSDEDNEYTDSPPEEKNVGNANSDAGDDKLDKLNNFNSSNGAVDHEAIGN